MLESYLILNSSKFKELENGLVSSRELKKSLERIKKFLNYGLSYTFVVV